MNAITAVGVVHMLQKQRLKCILFLKKKRERNKIKKELNNSAFFF